MDLSIVSFFKIKLPLLIKLQSKKIKRNDLNDILLDPGNYETPPCTGNSTKTQIWSKKTRLQFRLRMLPNSFTFM